MIGGLIIISTGVTGLYIGRVFSEVRERPLFVIDRTTGDEHEQPAAVSAAQRQADRMQVE